METQNPIAAITTALKVLNPDNNVIELRILNTPRGTLSGYFDNMDVLAEQAAAWSGAAPVYITLNSVIPELLARAQNRTEDHAKTATSDEEILKRIWLPIDFDPVRPSGISSTDEEHEAALERARQIVGFTKSLGWPDPVIADSGNGGHVLFQIDLPHDEASQKLIKKVLQALDLRFSDDKVSVDTGVDNEARIWKLYGTIACKGDNTSERPHRLAHIIETPETIGTVSVEQLQALADMLPVEPPSGEVSGRKFNLPGWIKKYNPPIASSKPWNGGTVYVMGCCPWNKDHTNGSAYIIQFASGAIAAGCHHSSCRDKKWPDLRALYEPGYQDHQDHQKKSQADSILEDLDEIGLFHDSLNQAYARIEVDGHLETWPVKCGQFALWVQYQYHKKTGRAANSEAIRTVQNAIEARARFDAEERTVELRVAKHGDAFWYDLANNVWGAVRTTPEGWAIEAAPEFFRRYGSTKYQVEPVRNGNFNKVLDFINLKNESDKALFQVKTITDLVPNIPHPVVVVHGGHGTAKTTAIRIMQALVDPAGRDPVAMPKSMQDLAIYLRHNYMAAFDNLDALNGEQSNLLCSACTGGGITKRVLYSDEDEIILSFKRCITFNGINVVASRADLLDRSLLFELISIEKKDRKAETAFWDEFDAAKPEIVGGMFDVLSKAMSIYPDVKIAELPRMADFCRWGYAVAEALGIGGEKFMEYYSENMNTANQEAISSDPVAVAVMAFMEKQKVPEIVTKMSDLYDGLVDLTLEVKIDKFAKSWPKSASSLSARLKRIASNLKDAGISCSIERSTAKPTKGCSMVTLKTIGSDSQQVHRPAQIGTSYHIPAGVIESANETAFSWGFLHEDRQLQDEDGASSDSGASRAHHVPFSTV